MKHLSSLITLSFIFAFAFLSYPSVYSHRVFESVASTFHTVKSTAQVSSSIDTFFELSVDKNLTSLAPDTYAVVTNERAGNGFDRSGSITDNIMDGSVSLPVSTQTGVTFSKNLFYGQENADVLTLQTKLKSLGYFSESATPNGYFGRQTLTAVIKYQRAVGIPTTGFVGPLTRVGLENISSLAHL